MTCEACGGHVSLEASQASSRLATLPEKALVALRENFDGRVPETLCAECFLPHYSHALAVIVAERWV